MHIDASGVVVKYVANADMRRALKLRDQYERAMNNLMILTPSQIDRAGLNPEDVTRIRSRITEYHTVMMFLMASRQMTENLQQTIFVLGHEIAASIGEITAQARRRAKVSPNRGEILNALSPLIEYHTAPAKKARATRLKNESQEGKPATPSEGNDKAPKVPGALARSRSAQLARASNGLEADVEEAPASAAG
ncbi:Hypothetical protein CAP_1914 [Chondromyces apiculatus DSM 436]|uniref:Uncharacterized protein n=2 Tax=Chondromyces apiculatus TaxID=51 RepID=A0A017TAW4_9BACT|nr:Hypothetical protein CAP_1914 [Chondromyces apiculatus DSM 436]